MINITTFKKSHIDKATEIALMNYNEEKTIVTELPSISALPNLEEFADNELGVSMLSENNILLGFLCCYNPWNGAFNSAAKGTFSPIHSHGAIFKNRSMIYKRMYQAAAEKWVKYGITYHAIGLYAHDSQATDAFFTYGFGLRCVDAVRSMNTIDSSPCNGIFFNELAKSDVIKIRELREKHNAHMAKSPCFMLSPPIQVQNWITRAEKRDSRVFVANNGNELIAYIEIMDSGESFLTENRGMKNICGAFCLPDYRGKGIVQGLLNHMITTLKDEGYNRLGVDFESFNPTANGFWLKYFTAYTNSVVRRIDEYALLDI